MMSKPTLVLVHGRSQQGLDPVELSRAWMQALKQGLGPRRAALLDGVDVAFPFYGNVLDAFVKQLADAVPADVMVRGAEVQGDAKYLAFQQEYLKAVAARLDIRADSLDAPAVIERGALNWSWVQSLLRAADALPGVSAAAIEGFTRDVYVYLSRSKIREEVNRIVADAIPSSRSVVVGHSLGSVVAYDVLTKDVPGRDVSLYVTVGSPLGVGPIKRVLAPIEFPKRTAAWFNALDRRDVVALNPLDPDHFAVTPSVENYVEVHNGTENAHGIAGYLSDPIVADRIATALGLLAGQA